jgi:hypothetical protein
MIMGRKTSKKFNKNRGKNLLPPLAWSLLLPSFLPNSKLTTMNFKHIRQGINETCNIHKTKEVYNNKEHNDT